MLPVGSVAVTLERAGSSVITASADGVVTLEQESSTTTRYVPAWALVMLSVGVRVPEKGGASASGFPSRNHW